MVYIATKHISYMDLLCLQGAHINSFDNSNAYFCLFEHLVLVFRSKCKFYALKHVSFDFTA